MAELSATYWDDIARWHGEILAGQAVAYCGRLIRSEIQMRDWTSEGPGEYVTTSRTIRRLGSLVLPPTRYVLSVFTLGHPASEADSVTRIAFDADARKIISVQQHTVRRHREPLITGSLAAMAANLRLWGIGGLRKPTGEDYDTLYNELYKAANDQ